MTVCTVVPYGEGDGRLVRQGSISVQQMNSHVMTLPMQVSFSAFCQFGRVYFTSNAFSKKCLDLVVELLLGLLHIAEQANKYPVRHSLAYM